MEIINVKHFHYIEYKPVMYLAVITRPPAMYELTSPITSPPPTDDEFQYDQVGYSDEIRSGIVRVISRERLRLAANAAWHVIG